MPATIKSGLGRVGVAVALMFIASGAYSDKLHQEDGIMNNHSTEYVRMLNRNASTDPDAAFYNPAGLAFMKQNGLYINFSSQTYHVLKSHTLDFYAIKRGEDPVAATPHKLPYFEGTMPKEYKAELTAPVLPGFDAVWKQDRWALYFDLAVMQAAMDMTYGKGLAVLTWGNLITYEKGFDTNDRRFKYFSANSEAIRNEMYLGFTVGGAYRFMDWISAGGGVRVISAGGNMKVKSNQIRYFSTDTNDANWEVLPGDDWDIDTDTKGLGIGFILGTHFNAGGLVQALKGLNAALRLEYYLPMELEKKTNKFIAPPTTVESGNLDIFMDGSNNPNYLGRPASKTLKATYPPTLSFGLSYMLMGWINIASSSQITLRQLNDLDGREKDFNIGYNAGLGVEFILSDQITLSTGYLYNDFGIKPEKRNEADPLLRSHTLGGGGKFTIDDRLSINLGMFFQFYVPATNYEIEYTSVGGDTWSYLKKDLKESRFSVSIGVTYRLFGGTAERTAGKGSLLLPHNQ